MRVIVIRNACNLKKTGHKWASISSLRMDFSSLLDVAKSVVAFIQAEGSPLPKVLMLLGVVSFTAGLALQQVRAASSKTVASEVPPVQTQQTTISPTITVSPTINVANGVPQTQHAQPTQHEPKTQESKPAITAAPPAVTPTPAPAIHQESSGSGNNIIQGPNGRVEINNYGIPSPPPTSVLRLQTVPLEKPAMPIGLEPVKRGPNDYSWKGDYIRWNQQMAVVRAFRPGIQTYFKVPRTFVQPAFRITCDVACVLHSF